ncbi:MAG: NlpC/P60 family protein [Sphingomonadales bacterium]|nr:NlpC/P60 family protein [Sphingomonadales bacterium]
MFRSLVLLLVIFLASNAVGQDAKIETLQQLYNQGYYKMVYRRAGRLLMNPAYDNLKEPNQYRSMAIQELAKNPRWAKRHALEIEWMEKPTNQVMSEQQKGSSLTQELIHSATQLMGIPYKAAGSDTMGFDCSGFTCYVFEKQGVKLPRRAADQFAFCEQISAIEAKAGDLVFFSNGTDVNHVGILISEKNAPKQMIHSSSSIGITIVDIEQSTYWQSRIVGYGRALYP